MKEQSAVQWLVDSIEGLEKSWVENIINTDEYFSNIEWVKIKAKEMHKQQIIDAWKMGRYENDKIVMSERFYSEQYYNETYGSNGSETKQ